jgi:outer membrane protein assembly factor BamB
MKTASVITLLLVAAIPLAQATDWRGWRGDGTGVSTEKNLPIQWSADQHVRWRVSVPGYGWSCPVVAGNRIFLTTAVCAQQEPPPPKGPGGGAPAPDKLYRWEVHCLDSATGHTLWKQVAAEHKPHTGNHVCNTYASETPVTDGERVYAYFGMCGVFCFDLNGKPLWNRDLGAYRTFANWGSSSSPALDGERLFVQCDNEQQSFLVALDKKTGNEMWRVAREERSTWSTPILWRNRVCTELVCMGSNFNRAYDPATGRELWRCASERSLGGGGPPPPPPGRDTSGSKAAPGGGGGKSASGGCKASPVADSELLYLGMSSKAHGQELGPMWAIKADATGDISLRAGQATNAHVAWFRSDAGPHFTSAVLHADRLYIFPPHAGGVLSCFDAGTGATVFEASLAGANGFKASPCVFDGKIICTDESGTTFVVEAGPKFKLLAKNPLGEMTWSSPALSGGALFIRTVHSLFCIER